MQRLCPLIFILFFSCDVIEELKIDDVQSLGASCTITLSGGGTIIGKDVKIRKSTNTLTYRDPESKLWTLFEEEYSAYSCGG